MAAVLLIHGTKDTLVPFKQSQELEGSLKTAKGNVQLLPIKGADHIFTEDEEKEADAAAIKFLDEMLRSKRQAKEAGQRTPSANGMR
jgi:dipeptidyl aminopeptidase/acylaminoacyl peptidase